MKKQNYKESKLILEQVKKAKKILLNCHRGPDPDSIGGALALYEVLSQMGKYVEVVCFSDELYGQIDFLKNYKKIQKSVDFNKFNYDKFDLFITSDSSSWDMVTGNKNFQKPELPVANIDHHGTNTNYGKINLVDKKKISVCEILYLVFEDWNVKINKHTAQALLSGIIGDSGIFRYPGTTQNTLSIASKLMELGAEKDKIIFNIYSSADINLLKFWGEVLINLKMDASKDFVYSAIPYKVFESYGKPIIGKESAASMFASIVSGTKFGFVAVEQEPNIISISLRTRTGFDTSKIAIELGGGGHVAASGARIEGLAYDKAIEKVLTVARKYAHQTTSHDA